MSFLPYKHIKQKSRFYGTHKLLEKIGGKLFLCEGSFGKIPDAPKEILLLIELHLMPLHRICVSTYNTFNRERYEAVAVNQ